MIGHQQAEILDGQFPRHLPSNMPARCRNSQDCQPAGPRLNVLVLSFKVRLEISTELTGPEGFSLTIV